MDGEADEEEEKFGIEVGGRVRFFGGVGVCSLDGLLLRCPASCLLSPSAALDESPTGTAQSIAMGTDESAKPEFVMTKPGSFTSMIPWPS